MQQCLKGVSFCTIKFRVISKPLRLEKILLLKSSHTLETTSLCPDMSKVFYEELNKRNYYNCK